MSAPRWPTPAPLAPAPAPAPVQPPVLVDDPEAAAQKLEVDLRAARAESEAAVAALDAARNAFPQAAAQGLDAVRAAQREASAAADRVKLAEEVVTALEAAHRPLAEAGEAVRRERRRTQLAADLGAALTARDRIDEEVVAAVDALAAVAARREDATAAALAIERRAAAERMEGLPSVERYMLPARILDALARIPAPIGRAFAR